MMINTLKVELVLNNSDGDLKTLIIYTFSIFFNNENKYCSLVFSKECMYKLAEWNINNIS